MTDERIPERGHAVTTRFAERIPTNEASTLPTQLGAAWVVQIHARHLAVEAIDRLVARR